MVKKYFILVITVITISCAVTHHKKNLKDFNTNAIPAGKLKLDGYYYTEFETDTNSNYNTNDKIKRLNAFFFYEDGFSLFLQGLSGLYRYYCAEGHKMENSFKNTHNNIKLLVEAQKSNDKKIRKRCDFEPSYINHKGLINLTETNGKIKIQYYQTEFQIPNKDSFNSYYLYEMNGEVKNDSTFIIYELKNYRANKSEKVNIVYKYYNSKKPKVTNYFKDKM